jgi:hypothetical protein
MISKQIGQSRKYNLLYDIVRKLDRITKLAPYIGWNIDNGGGETDLALGTIEALDKDLYQVNARAVLNQILYAPSIYYDSVTSRTYCAYRFPTDAERKARPAMFFYDPNNGISKHIVVGPYLVDYNDEHPHPSILTKNNRMYVTQEVPHNTSLRVLKARYDDDITGGCDILTALGNEVSYSELMDNGSNAVLFYRSGSAGGGTYEPWVLKSTSGFDTWPSGNGNRIISRNFTGYDRIYVSMPHNNYVDGWWYYEFTLRNDAVAKWGSTYVAKTQDHDTFYNLSESFSKNISLGTALTNVEMDTYFKVFTIANNTLDGNKPCSAISPEGRYYGVRDNGVGGHTFFYSDELGVITEKSISIPNSVGGPVNTQDSAFVFMMAVSDNNIQLFVRRQPGTYKKIYRYKSTDQGTTWVLQNEMFPAVNADFNYIGAPTNCLLIPNNTNFIFWATEADTGLDAIVRTYTQRAAWGTVQSETPVVVTDAYTNINEVGETVMFAYDVQPGWVTNTGTTLTGLIDQSSNGRVATISGSPVVDNATPNYITFDGVDDKIELATTGITALTKGTLVLYARKRAAQTTSTRGGIGASIAADANEGWFMGIDSSGNSGMRVARTSATAAKAVNYQGSTDTVDDEFRVYAFNFETAKQDLLYNNAVRENANYVSGNRLANGSAFDQISGMDKLVLGAMVRTVTSFYDFDLKAVALFSNTLSADKIARLSNMYLTRPAAVQPTIQATNVLISGHTSTSLTLNWTNGNGLQRIVIVKAGTVDGLPVDNTTYTASSTFGSGSQIGTGNYVVYKGTGTSVTITGLSGNTDYYIRVFEFSGAAGSENYLTSTATGNPANDFTFTTQYQNVQNRITALAYTGPSTAKKTKENAFYKALIAANLHTVAIGGKMFKTDGDGNSATIDWVTPSSQQATRVNSIVHTSDLGFTGNGSTTYLLSGINLSSITQNDVTYCVRGFINTGDASSVIFGAGNGTTSSGNRLRLNPKNTGNQIGFNISDATGLTATNTDGTNRISIARVGNTVYTSINGAAFASQASTFAAVTTPKEIALLAFNGSSVANHSNRGISYFWVFSRKLTDVENAAFDAAVVNYLS